MEQIQKIEGSPSTITELPPARLLESKPAFVDGFSFREWMIVRDDMLVPDVEITRKAWGLNYKYLSLSRFYLPMLERIDGERTVKEIIDTIISEHRSQFPVEIEKRAADAIVNEIRRRITAMFQEIFQKGVLRFN